MSQSAHYMHMFYYNWWTPRKFTNHFFRTTKLLTCLLTYLLNSFTYCQVVDCAVVQQRRGKRLEIWKAT